MKIHVKLNGKLVDGPNYKHFEVVSSDVIDASAKSFKAKMDKLFKDDAMSKLCSTFCLTYELCGTVPYFSLCKLSAG